MGAVLLASHVSLGTPAVIKVILPEAAAQDERARQRFFNEARLSSAIRHENVVRIYDFGELPDGTLYTIMELVPGEDLEELLKREGRMEPLRAARILRQVAAALEAAHSHPGGAIVHRDLKPSNIRIAERDRGEHVTVLDFGISRVAEREGGAADPAGGHPRDPDLHVAGAVRRRAAR
ncbi:MAG: hypothetical protein KatS3mg102_2467 [Planctomycetota bacterium]|nr:MAG: hypothetical protein KatS3mg102_2467 [Planctomycetota bacterium]